MPDNQYWNEMDKARHYPLEQKTKMEAAALKASNNREKKKRIAERKAIAKQTVELRKIAKKKEKAKEKAKPKKKSPKKRKTAKTRIQKTRGAVKTFKNIFG